MLLFTTAVAYVKEIGLISRELNDIKSDFKAYEELEDSKAIIVEMRRRENRDALPSDALPRARCSRASASGTVRLAGPSPRPSSPALSGSGTDRAGR